MEVKSYKIKKMLKQVQHDKLLYCHSKQSEESHKREKSYEILQTFTFPRNDDSNKCNRLFTHKCAFTLAEVLITLGIIGVVAAMTIPTLMSNYRKKQLETQIKANYSLVQQAIKFADYDDVSYDMAIKDGSDASIQEWYDSFLSKHLKVEQFCSNAKSGCWHKKGIVKDLLGNAPRYEFDNGIGGNIVNFKLANGAFFNVDGNTAEDMKSFGIDSTSDGLTFYFDANGDKKPNQFGKDIYIMVWTDKGLVPAGYNRTKAEVDANCLRGDGYFCLQKVISEGWQISDEVWRRH